MRSNLSKVREEGSEMTGLALRIFQPLALRSFLCITHPPLSLWVSQWFLGFFTLLLKLPRLPTIGYLLDKLCKTYMLNHSLVIKNHTLEHFTACTYMFMISYLKISVQKVVKL